MADEFFRVDLNMSMYLDRSQQYVTFELYKDQILPIPACNYDTTYGIPGKFKFYSPLQLNGKGHKIPVSVSV